MQFIPTVPPTQRRGVQKGDGERNELVRHQYLLFAQHTQVVEISIRSF
jgi:hypothetical protein